jgi:hypothetical protein
VFAARKMQKLSVRRFCRYGVVQDSEYARESPKTRQDRQGKARQENIEQEKQYKARQEKQNKAREDKTKQEKTRQQMVKTKQSEAKKWHKHK